MEEVLGVDGAVLEGMLDPKEGMEIDVTEMERGVAEMEVDAAEVEVDAAEVTEDGMAGVKELELLETQTWILLQLEEQLKPYES